MDTVNLTITPAQWGEIAAGLNERPMKSALPVLQACSAQIDEQIAAHEILLSQRPKEKAPPQPGHGYVGHIPLGYAKGETTPRREASP